MISYAPRAARLKRVMNGIQAAFDEKLPPVAITQCGKYNLCQLEQIHRVLAGIGIVHGKFRLPTPGAGPLTAFGFSPKMPGTSTISL